MVKKSLLIFSLLAIVVFFGQNLNPFSNQMFEAHDSTQAARIQQFSQNLKNFRIPPRVAPDFDNGQGYPVFNFYAPAAYWITSVINLLGLDTVAALKLSFLIATVLSFIFAYLFLRNFFDEFPALIGAILYTTAVYIPADIFVRGNLAEVWFITLMPLSLFFISKNSQKPGALNFFLGTTVLFLSFTSHNILSLVFIPIVFIFALLLKNKKINLLSIALALLLSSYFLLPLLLENHLTIAKQMAQKTHYQDHFLCINQLWESPWGYGGSISGCRDGMSFKLGKFQIIFALLGIATFVFKLKNKKNDYLLLVAGYLLLVTLLSLFMTTYLARPIWDLFSPVLAVFQFPWRFIAFSLIGLSFFSAYFWQAVKFPLKNVIILFFVVISLIVGIKYFKGRSMAKPDFEEKYLSEVYIRKEAALQIPEYFSSQKVKIDWGKTFVEKTANLITLLSFGFLGILTLNKSLWKKLAS